MARTESRTVVLDGHVVEQTRVVSEWRQDDVGDDHATIPLDEDSDVVDVYAIDANRTRLQISNADGDYFAAHLAPIDVLLVIEALAAHA